MLYDLIRALPVAILVCFVPGWFWSRLLGTSADRAEQVAYSVALAITLVPTAALVLSRILGTGVTLAVAVTAPVLVFLTGLLAYLWFGPAKGPDAPLTPLPASPRTPALLLLVAALALALVAFFDLVPGVWSAIFVVSLVLFAGIVHLLTYPRPDPSQSGSPNAAPAVTPGIAPSAARWVRYGVLSVVLLLVLLRGYLGPLLHRWPYPRGVDRYEHAVMTGMTLSEGSTESFMLYPPGFHFLTAEISRLTGLEPLAVFPILAPALLLLPALACYALANRLWGWECGAAAALFSGLILGGSYLHFAEARYPNFIGTQFLVVLAVAALIGMYASPPSVRGGLLLAILGSSTVLYHQIAGYSLAVILALVGLLFVPYLLLRDRARGMGLFLSLTLLGLFSVFYAWDTYDLPRLVAGLLGGSDTGAGGTAVAIAVGSQEPLSLGHLLATTSQPVAWLGLLGALLVAGELLRRRVDAPQSLAYLTLVFWALLLFAGSRTPLSGFPQRFERDLGIPLAALATFAFVAMLRSAWPREPAVSPTASLKTRLATVLVSTLAVVVVGLQTAESLNSASRASANVISRQVALAGEWLGKHNGGGNIVVTPYLNDHIPGSAMLAMGGYTGLRSYAQDRLRSPRALPPSGREPLLAAHWMTRHPVGGRTESLHDRYDVRYVVLFKRYPGVPWRAFEGASGAYEKVFENGAMVIFAPREGPRPSG